MKIYVYTIAKDEEEFCERWCASAKAADGLYVLDTGSSDNTVTTLRRLGAHVVTMKFEPWQTLQQYDEIISRGGQPWRFDIPRNANLEMIPIDADVCIQVDMDEVLVDGWRDIIERNWGPGTTRLDYLYAWSMNGDTPGHTFHYNKCHSRRGYHWIKPVHEIVWPKDGVVEKFSYCNTLLVKHHPKAKDRSSYLHLLELSCREEPLDTMNGFNLAREYSFYSMWNETISATKRYLLLPGATWSLERSSACLLAAKSFGALKDVSEQHRWLLKSVAEDASSREGWCALADHYRLTGDNIGGYFAAKKALEVKRHPMSHHNTVEAWREQPDDLAAVCGFYAGFKNEAVEHAWSAVKANPFDGRLIDNYEKTLACVETRTSTAGVPIVDVLVLSWSKDKERYDMTVKCINNLRLSSAGIPLNIVVVETNANITNEPFVNANVFGSDVKLICPNEPFGYNRYLQIGYAALSGSKAKFIMILNNDVVIFNRHFMVRMIVHMATFSSVSPLGLREAQWGRINQSINVHSGYDLNVINGWCILFDKTILNAISFDRLFPAQLEFHRQDEFYADMLKSRGIRHALVCDAQALHLQAQSHALLSDEQKKKFTVGQEKPYFDLLKADAAFEMPKVWDCFTFWRELDILEMRLETMDSVVDKFVLVESDKTHSGLPKDLIFEKHKDRFARFMHKIVHVVVTDMPSGENRWARENHQRNAIIKGLVGASDRDMVMISDVDEIPKPNVVIQAVANSVAIKTGTALRQNMYNYYYNLRNTVEDWIGTIIVSMDDIRRSSPQALRDARHGMTKLDNAGWHFSWIGDEALATQKLESFAHAEYDTTDIKSKLGERMRSGLDFAGRHTNVFSREEIKTPEFPSFLVTNKIDFIL